MMREERVYAIIPAAGQGSRMGMPGQNKQFLELCGMPVLARTLMAFEHSSHIDGIVVVSGPSEKDQVLSMCARYHIGKLLGIAEGGATRQDSVRHALEFLGVFLSSIQSPQDHVGDYVLIHDGARPFVSEEVIVRCIHAVKLFHACGAGVMVKDTIKRVAKDGRILHTPSREGLWAIQTPQAFLFSMIGPLHQKAYEDKLSFTDDTAIAEHYGETVHMVPGDYQNIKITTQEDLLYGEVLLKSILDRKPFIE
jgi:2-C-methyl-D-erythritol 4-phosphate cytidylyltransferase